MRRRRAKCASWMPAAVAVCIGLAAAAAEPPVAQQVLAEAPTDLSVTVYRASGRDAGSLELDNLRGFALIRETRLLRLPAGLSRVRFEGVADGIAAASVIVTGLPQGVVEKDLDARLLSPSALLAAAAGGQVVLVRTDPKTGSTQRVSGTLLSGADADGVVFQTQDGIEALRCSGLSETFTFAAATGLSATPTLSVLIRTARPLTQQIQLSYLATGFDWAADYTATLSADDRTIDLGAWVTLANSNGIGFPRAQTQVVAGRLNRESSGAEPVDRGGPVLAQCWPQGRTTDRPAFLEVRRAFPLGFEPLFFARYAANAVAAPGMLEEVAVTGSRVRQEQLGDLKLYRVPGRTTVASYQSKQVRLLDRQSIPVHQVFSTQVADDTSVNPGDSKWVPASVLLRTRNDAENHLGLPLPSGRVAVFKTRLDTPLLLNEADMRDLAVNEEVEIQMGTSSAVQVKATTESASIDPARVTSTPLIPMVPGVVAIRRSQVDYAKRVEVTNARDAPIDFELQLRLREGGRVIRADHPLGTKNGRPIIRLRIPAHDAATVRYQTEHSENRVTVPR
jgi:hypothetical protein